VGRYFGPVLSEVDYTSDPDAVAHQINDWVAENTEDRITDLIPDGVLDDTIVLTLVNALYLTASWFTPFEESETEDGPFTLADGSEVTVPLMHGGSNGSTRGDGWVGASKDLTGGLAVQFVLPDEGRFDDVAADLPAAFDQIGQSEIGAELVLPRLESRFGVPLGDALKALGLTAPFDDSGVPGQLVGIADDDTLAISDVIHQTFVAMDEGGVEAAAATAVVFSATGAPIGDPPVPVVLDRPFFFRIVDQETGATLFLGRIMDPS
jgi:serpin B